MLNIVALMGRLVADPELRQTPSGVSVCRFRIAVDRSYAGANGERKADFIDITAWRGTGEFVSKYFTKGKLIAVSGELQTNQYTAQDGTKRTGYTVVAANVSFAGDGARSGAAAVNGTALPVIPALAVGLPPQGSNDFQLIEDSEDLPF